MKCLQKSGIGHILSLGLLALTLCSATSAYGQAAPSIGGAVVVTPSTPGFNPAGAASNNAYGVYESLSKSAGTGRVGYPSVPVANQSAMSGTAARNAMRGVWRAAGWAGFALAVVYAGGEFLNYLQCSTNGICKPSGAADPRPSYSGGAGYCYSRNGVSFCVDASAASSAASTVDQMCRSGGMCNWDGQTIIDSNCTMGGVDKVNCTYHFKQNSSGTVYSWSLTFTGTYKSSGTPYTNQGGQPVPATDDDLNRAADAYRSNYPDRFVGALKSAGAWAPDKNTMTAPQPDVAGAPLIRELPEDKPGAPAGNKIEEITPHTAAKPAADAQSVNVYNYNVTTVTHTDGSKETEAVAESPNLDIPDDYAREETQQDIAEDVAEIRKQLEPDNLPHLDDAPTFADSMQRLRTRLAESPIGRAVEEAKPDSDTVDGICPVGNFTAFGQAFTIDAHCDLYEANSSLITGAMWAVWIIAAILFFMSA